MSKTATAAISETGLTRKILGNSLALFTSKLLAKVFRVVANFLLARYFGPENFGTWALILTFAELFRFIPDFGLERTLIRRMAASQQAARLSATLFLRGVFSGAAVLIAWAALFFTGYDPHVRHLIYFYSLSFFLQAAAGAFSAYFQAQLKSASLVWAYTASGVLYFLIVVGGVFGQQTLSFFLISLLTTEAVLVGLFYFTFRREGGRLSPFNFSELPPMVKEALPFVAWLGLGTIYFRMDTLLVYHFTGERGAGLYYACFLLSEGFSLLAAAAAASLFPVFSRLRDEGKSEAFALYQKSFFWFLVPVFPLAIFITGLSGPIINFLYGEAFVEAAAGLTVIIWSVVFMFANILSTKVIVAFGRETSFAKIMVLNLALNLALNFYLLPRWGFIGACWATVATEALNFALQLWVVQRIFGQKLFGAVLPKLIPPAAALGWFFLHPSSFQTAGVYLFVFGYLVYLFNRRGHR